MRIVRCFLLMAGGVGLGLEPPSAPSREADPPADPSRLIGTWLADLRPRPDAPDYDQEFVVRGVANQVPVGTFYGRELQDARLNLDWGTTHFAFTTSDARERGTYNTAGRIVGDHLEGTTHPLGRNFLAVWTATRVPDPK